MNIKKFIILFSFCLFSHTLLSQSWSPDGQQISFTRDISEGTELGLPALFMVDMTGYERLITNQNSFD